MKNNIGILNEIFLQNIGDILKRNNGRKLIREYALMFKKNKNLLKEYIVFENISKINDNDNIKDYINENINYLNNINKSSLKSLNEMVLKFMVENKITQTSEIENEKLYEEIDSLIFTKKNVKTINERIDKINKISDYIKENKKPIEDADTDEDSDPIISENMDLIFAIAVNNFNKKYKDALTEEELVIFKELSSEKEPKEKELFFEENRKKCLNLTNEFLKESIDTETREKLLNVKEKLLEQKFNDEDYIEDVISFIELSKTLSE